MKTSEMIKIEMKEKKSGAHFRKLFIVDVDKWEKNSEHERKCNR